MSLDLSTCSITDLNTLIEIKENEILDLETDANTLPFLKGFIKKKQKEVEDVKNELSIRKDMKTWIDDDNVIKMGHDQFIEQTTQWKHIFSEVELIRFFKREYVNV